VTPECLSEGVCEGSRETHATREQRAEDAHGFTRRSHAQLTPPPAELHLSRHGVECTEKCKGPWRRPRAQRRQRESALGTAAYRIPRRETPRIEPREQSSLEERGERH